MIVLMDSVACVCTVIVIRCILTVFTNIYRHRSTHKIYSIFLIVLCCSVAVSAQALSCPLVVVCHNVVASWNGRGRSRAVLVRQFEGGCICMRYRVVPHAVRVHWVFGSYGPISLCGCRSICIHRMQWCCIGHSHPIQFDEEDGTHS